MVADGAQFIACGSGYLSADEPGARDKLTSATLFSGTVSGTGATISDNSEFGKTLLVVCLTKSA